MLTVEDIQRAVCDHFSVSLEDLKSHHRRRSIVLPRQMAMYLCRLRLNTSFEELGEQFGGKDHTTVMSAVRRIGGLLDEQKESFNPYLAAKGFSPHLATSVQAIEYRLDRPKEPEPEKGQTIMRVRVDGVLEYAVGLSKADAEWLRRLVDQQQSGMSGGRKGGARARRIVKSLDWVIETAERDERWAAQRAAGEVPDV